MIVWQIGAHDNDFTFGSSKTASDFARRANQMQLPFGCCPAPFEKIF
jgi:hypothetical protein